MVHERPTENSLIERPTVLAAVIAAAASLGVAMAGAIGGGISSYFQSQSDLARLKTTILLELVKKNDADAKKTAGVLIQSGVLPDADGAICMAFVGAGEGCPIKVAKPR